MLKDDILANICTREDVDWQLASLAIPADPKRQTDQADLRRRLRSLPVLRLRVAVDLPRASIERICARARRLFLPDVVLDIEVDPVLVAGAQISWQGKYVDLSKKAQLDEVLKGVSLEGSDIRRTPLQKATEGETPSDV